MYSEKVDNSHGVTIKQCHRVKGLKNHVEAPSSSELDKFIRGSGFEMQSGYETSGEEFVFLLNDYSDLKSKISADKQSQGFKCTLRLSKMFRHEQGRANEIKILDRLFEADEPEVAPSTGQG